MTKASLWSFNNPVDLLYLPLGDLRLGLSFNKFEFFFLVSLLLLSENFTTFRTEPRFSRRCPGLGGWNCVL